MFIVKRTKAAPPGHGETRPGPVATHWAVSVAPAGNVTRWTAEREQALPVDADLAARVRKYHAGRAAAGRVELEPVAAAVEAPEKVEPPPPPAKSEQRSEPKKAQIAKQN